MSPVPTAIVRSVDDLADDAVGVDDGLPVVDAGAAADADDEIVLVGVGIDGQDFGDADLVAHPGTGLEHCAQAGVLGLQCRQPLQPGVGEQLFGPQAAELQLEFVARRR
ncbi:MAG: hypothetical protein P8Y01_11035 [Woeseiaceae bacterium]